MTERFMRDYARPDFAQKQNQREVDKLNAILQALKNCHKAMGTINGGEDAFLALQSIQEASHHVSKIRYFKSNALQPVSSQSIIDVDSEDLDEIDQFM